MKMKNEPSLLTIAKNLFTGADTVGKNKDGHVVFRFGFYYTNRRNAAMMATIVINEFAKIGVVVECVDCYEKWLPFKGGAPVSRQSHWGVVVKKKEVVNS